MARQAKKYRDMTPAEKAQFRSVLSRRQGWVYLIELDRAIGDTERRGCSARFYLGWTADLDPFERLAEHRAGQGSKMLAYCNRIGVGYQMIACWNGTACDERRLKDNGHFDRLAAKVRTLNSPDLMLAQMFNF